VDETQKEEKSIKQPETEIREEVKKKPEKEEMIRPLYRFLIKLCIFSLLMIMMFTFVFGIRINREGRMYPYIMEGDVLIMLKITSYKVGDVVAYRNPETGRNEISRIAAAGPCEVDAYYGEFMVNGEAKGKESFYETSWPDDSRIPNPYEVETGSYFLLDDNRPSGEDSRLFGQISKKDLKGKVIYIFRLRGI
jgi:signal peptidase I